MISPQDLHLYSKVDSFQAAVDEILSFYRNFDSMRYVRHNLVFRLTREIDDSTLQYLNECFVDILVDGCFRQTAALPAERDEPALVDRPRLVFHFNRRDFGRLRQLIDYLNREIGATAGVLTANDPAGPSRAIKPGGS
jgi:hypothetical protein